MNIEKMSEKDIDQAISDLQALLAHDARKKHLDFMEFCWLKNDPFVKGFHTRKICERIDQAFNDFRDGKSTYLIINVHHRSGKSDILSRYLPPHFLGEFPDCEIISTSFKADLTAKFTSFARNIFKSDKYQDLYPGVELSRESNAKAYWEIVDKKTGKPTFGKLFGSGLSSGITGSGAHLALLDDPISGRAAAESPTIRDKIWEAVTNDLMTRLGPVHIVIILATQWHWDDPSGRIMNEIKLNPYFPQFEVMRFPAKAKDYKGEGSYPNEYLFEERYSKTWYRNQYATLGKYASSALMDCDPQLRTGGILSTEGIVFHDQGDPAIPSETKVQWARIWDLAHTAKQRSGDDPDYTSGTLLAFQDVPGDQVPHLWIKHRVRLRAGAVERDKKIKLHTEKDGKFTKHGVESSVDSKDAYEYICQSLPEYNWEKIDIEGDKTVRATPLEPIFEARGHVHVIRGDWNDEWVDEITKFDGSGKHHDDGIDNLSAGYIMLVGSRTKLSDDLREQMRRRRQG